MQNYLPNYLSPRLSNLSQQQLGPVRFPRGGAVMPNTRVPYPTEDMFFQDNPNVGGMATSDGKVIISDHSRLNDLQKQSVYDYESTRLFMRNTGIRPVFGITPDQQKEFANYGNEQDIRETLVGRIVSGDYSALNVTPEQKAFADRIKPYIYQNKGLPENAKHDIDNFDYDMDAALAAGLQANGNQHWPDTYKKPNHITFSNQSIYHGKDGNIGGEWIDLGNNRWKYKVSPTNLKYHSKETIKNYISKHEPTTVVEFPDGEIFNN